MGGTVPPDTGSYGVTVAVGSTPELTPMVVLTLKCRPSCSPVPEGLHSNRGCLITGHWVIHRPSKE